VYALDAGTGVIRWRHELAGAAGATTVANGIVYSCSSGGYLHALDASTGNERWRYDMGCAVDAPPAIADGVVYAGSKVGEILAIDAVKGTLLGRTSVVGPVIVTPSVADGLVLVTSLDGTVYALRTRRWYALRPSILASILLVLAAMAYLRRTKPWMVEEPRDAPP